MKSCKQKIFVIVYEIVNITTFYSRWCFTMISNIIEPKISVIVPVFNVSGTLAATIKSIQTQTCKDLEIILIDDGSTDKSGEICDIFAENDSRIKVVHQENSGVSVARNTGIRMATANYICFVDADDEIEPTLVEELIKKQQESEAQCVILGVNEYHRKLIRPVCEETCTINLTNADDKKLVSICSKNIMTFPIAKLFSKSILLDNDVFFKKGLVCGEDHLFVFQYLLHTETISFINKPLYRYYCFNSNGSGRFFPLSGQIDIFLAKKEFIKKNCSEAVANSFCAQHALRNLIARFNYLAKHSITDYNELTEACDFYLPYILPLVDDQNAFLEDDYIWLKQNKQNLLKKNLKPIFKAMKKKNKKTNKHIRNLKEILHMSTKEKIKFVIEKIK